MASSQVQGGVANNKASRLARIEEPGLHLLDIANLGDADVVMTILQRTTKRILLDASGVDSRVSSESGRDGGSLANTPVVPGSVEVQATGINSLKDKNLDGNLYWDRVPGTALVTGTDGATAGATLTSAGSSFITAGVVAGDTVTIKQGDDQGKYTIIAVTATTLVVSVVFAVGGGSGLGFTVNAEDLIAGTINYFSGLLQLAYPISPAAASPANKGTVLGTEQFPINLDPGDTLIADIDVGGDLTATFDAAAAKHTAAAGTFAAMASETMEVQLETGEVQLITFGTEATIQAAADLITSQLEGGYAVPQGAQDVDLFSEVKGTSSRIRTTNVAAGITTKLGIANSGDDSGTGDVADINAITFAEAKAVIEADIADTLCELDGGALRITSDSVEEDASSSVNVNATSTAETKFGLDTTLHTGADADAKQPISVDYVSSSLVPAREVTQRRVTGRRQDIMDIYFAASGSYSRVRVDVRQDRGPR
jgi:hypothetical protein